MRSKSGWLKEYFTEKGSIPTPLQLRSFAVHRGGSITFKEAKEAVEGASAGSFAADVDNNIGTEVVCDEPSNEPPTKGDPEESLQKFSDDGEGSTEVSSGNVVCSETPDTCVDLLDISSELPDEEYEEMRNTNISESVSSKSSRNSTGRLSVSECHPVAEGTNVASLLQDLRAKDAEVLARQLQPGPGNRSWAVRCDAAESLAQMGDDRGYAWLVETLARGREARMAAASLARVDGEGLRPHVPKLGEILKTGFASARRAVLQVLAEVPDDFAVPYLAEALRDEDGPVRAAAAMGLAQHGAAAAPYKSELERLLKDPYRFDIVRDAARLALDNLFEAGHLNSRVG